LPAKTQKHAKKLKRVRWPQNEGTKEKEGEKENDEKRSVLKNKIRPFKYFRK
jgi:hypothetical protein